MNRDELLKMLDLAGKEAGPAEGDGLAVTPTTGGGDKPPASATALKVDAWGMRRGEELLEYSPRLAGSRLDAAAIADFHTAAFEPAPELLPACTDERRREFLEQMFGTTDYKALHATTMLREEAAEVAALSFADAYEKLLDDDEDAAEEKEREERRKAAGKPGDKGKGLIVAAPPAKDESLEKEMRAVRAAGAALTEASKDLEEMDEAARSLGCGPGGEGTNDPKRIAELYLKIRTNRALRRICELAGRYRRHAAGKQRMKTVHGYDDMVGVTLDGDPARLVSGDLAKLGVEELELDVMRRLAERQAVCRLHQAVEPVAKGPIVVVVDESGSMSGDPVHTAKAIALALAWIARQQRRWCALVAFSGGTEGRTLALPPGRWDETALMEWLEEFLSGGTSLDVPLHELPFVYWPRFTAQGLQRGKTDVVIITDCIVHAPKEMIESFNKWKAKEQVRITTLVIGVSPGDLLKVSDEAHVVTANFGVDEEGIDRALSI